MEWENKCELIKKGNAARDKTIESRTQFQSFVVDNVSYFDGQAWDMFSNLVDIIPAQMKEDIEFWRQVWPHLKSIDCNDEKFGFRSGLRISLLQVVCEDELKLNITPVK